MAGIAGSQPQDLASPVPLIQVEPPKGMAPLPRMATAEADDGAKYFSRGATTKPITPEDDGAKYFNTAEHEHYGKTLYRGALETLPLAGGIVGGAIGNTAAGPLGGLALGGLGYSAGRGLENLGKSFIGEGPKTNEEALKEQLKAVPEGVAQELGGIAIGKGLGVLGKGARAISSTIKGTLPSANKIVESALPGVTLSRKMNRALELQRATEETGIPLYAHERISNNPKLDALGETALGNKAYQANIEARGQAASDAIEELGKTFNPVADTNLTNIADKISVVDKAYGRLLGGARKQLIAESEKPLYELSIPAEHYGQQQSLFSTKGIPGGGTQEQLGLPGIERYDYAPSVIHGKLGPVQGGGRVESGQRSYIGSVLPEKQQQFLDARTTGLIASEGEQGAFQAGQAKSIGMTNLQQTVTDLQKKFGFVNGEMPKGEMLKSLSQDLNLQDSPGKAAYLAKQVERMSNMIQKGDGRLTPRQVDNLYTEFSKLTDTHFVEGSKQSEAFVTLMQLKNAIRDDFTQGIGTLLSPEAKATYQANMQAYHEIKAASDSVGRLLDANSPSASAILSYMKSKGLEGAERLSSMRKLVEFENPQLWENVSKSMWDDMLANHKLSDMAQSDRLGGTNWKKLNSTLDSGKATFEQAKAVFGEDRLDKLMKVTKVMAAAQEKDGSFKVDPGTATRLLQAALSLVKKDPKAATLVFSSDSAASALLNNGAVDKQLLRFGADSQLKIHRLKAAALNAASQQYHKYRTEQPQE